MRSSLGRGNFENEPEQERIIRERESKNGLTEQATAASPPAPPQEDENFQVAQKMYLDTLRARAGLYLPLWQRLHEIKEKTGVPLASGTAYKIYAIVLLGEHILELRNLNDVIEIPPPEEMVLKAYERLLKRLVSGETETGIFINLNALRTDTRVEPPGELVLDCYRKLLGSKNLSEIGRLRDALRVPLDELDAEIQKLYVELIEAGDPGRLLYLRDVTRIGANKDVVERYYRTFMETGNFSMVESLARVLPKGISISVEKEPAQSFYLQIMRENASANKNFTGLTFSPFINRLRQCEILTGQKMTQETVLAGYALYMAGGGSPYWPMLEIQQHSAVAIPDKYLRELWVRSIKEGSIEKAQGLKTALSEVPSISSDVANKGFDALISRRRYEKVKELSVLAGIEIGPDCIQRQVARIVEDGRGGGDELLKLLQAFPGYSVDWQSALPQVPKDYIDACASAHGIHNKEIAAKVYDILFEKLESLKIKREIEEEIEAGRDKVQKAIENAVGFLRRRNLKRSEIDTESQVRIANVPSYIRGILLAGAFQHPALVRGLDEMYGRRRGKELKEQAEFALVTLLHDARTGETPLGDDPVFSAVRSNLNKFFDRNPEVVSEDMVKVLDAINLLAMAYMNSGREGHEVVLRAVLETAPEEAFEGPQRYVEWIKQQRSKIFEEALGFSPSVEDYERVEKEWKGDFRPLVVLSAKYQGQYKEGIPLLQEYARAIFEGRWDEFRYESEDAAKLLEGLSEEQKKAWIENSPAVSLDEIQVTPEKTEGKRDEIREKILQGISQGHLYSAQHPDTAPLEKTYEWVRGVLQGEENFTFDGLKRAKQWAALELFKKTQLARRMEEFGLNAEEEGTFLLELLNQAEAKRSGLEASKADKSKIERLDVLLRWAREMRELEGERGMWQERFAVDDKTSAKDLGQLINSLDLAKSVVRLAQVSSGEIRANVMQNERGEVKGGELSLWLDALIQKFKKTNSAFAQDLENIRYMLGRKDAGGNVLSDLKIEETDNAKALLEVGKYPLGSQSCQNYEGNVQHNKCLLAYVADADKKMVVVRRKDGSIVARAIVKLVWVKSESGEEPALFLEPVYTSVNKGDHAFDGDFDRYLFSKAKNIGRVKVLRGS
ncbi:MAG: hypothetical protein HYV77_02260, partial [Candidatus Wildermuthbacteria bacterium]|nr:hypothetical protein [Candidatus Wildermuthbacteria bacterium]